tara:strand:+ start:1880 stop:2143 length:264 start_codon:yes stop_codon:yes gene_type:complete
MPNRLESCNLIALRLNNLIGFKGKKLSKKIKSQKKLIGNDRLKANVLLNSAYNRVVANWENPDKDAWMHQKHLRMSVPRDLYRKRPY